jgi:hypothetical protein
MRRVPIGPCLALVATLGPNAVLTLGGTRDAQDSGSEMVLAAGASQRIPDTDLTVSFEAAVEESRCPSGATCVWAGDVAVRIRIDTPKASSARYILHLNLPSAREAEHVGTRVRLLNVTPHPTTDHKPRPAEYRVTLLIKPR